jgi:hypothetical protein
MRYSLRVASYAGRRTDRRRLLQLRQRVVDGQFTYYVVKFKP